MSHKNFDEVKFEEITVQIRGKTYTVVPITQDIEEALIPLDEICIYQKPGALKASRQQVQLLLNMPEKEIKKLSALEINEIKLFIFQSLGEAKKKEEKKSG